MDMDMTGKTRKILYIGNSEGLRQLMEAGLHRRGVDIVPFHNIVQSRPHDFFKKFDAIIASDPDNAKNLDTARNYRGIEDGMPVFLFARNVKDLNAGQQTKFTAIITEYGGRPETLAAEIINLLDQYGRNAPPRPDRRTGGQPPTRENG